MGRRKRTAKEEFESINLAINKISEWLADGEIPLRVIKQRFNELGIPAKDVQKARQSLRVKTYMKNGEGFWVIPEPKSNPNQVYRWWRG